MSNLLLSRMSSVPWLILPEALDVMEAIAAREDVPAAALATWKEMARDGVPEPELLAQRRGSGVFAGASIRDGVAIVPVTGPIFPYAGMLSQMSGAVSLSTLSQVLGHLQANPDVKAIVLELDTPGGAATGVQEFASQIKQSTKPVTAYVVGMAASAGYWIAAAAREIVMAPTAYVGSIGAVMTVDDRRQERAMKGVARVEVVSKQSPNKRPDIMGDAGRALLQDMVDKLADDFVGDVAAWRKVPREKVLADFGQGWIVKGSEAVAAGMADRIGSLEQVLGELAAGGSAPRPSVGASAGAANRKDPNMEKPTVESIAKDYPEIAAHFRNEGAAAAAQTHAGEVERERSAAGAAERVRVLAIQAHGARCPGHDSIIKAGIESGVTADQVAAQLLEADAAKRSQVLTDLRQDDPAVTAAPAAGSAATSTQPTDPAAVQAAIAEIQKAEAAKGTPVSYVQAVGIFRRNKAA